MWWINIIVIFLLVIPLLAEVVWLCLSKKDTLKQKMIAWLSITLALFGIVVAISDDYLSQYDYKLRTIFKYEGYRRRGVSFDDLIDGKTKFSPEYIFALDVSGSTNNVLVKMTQEKADFLNRQINVVNNTGWLGTKRDDFGFDETENTIEFPNLLKIRLLYSLIQLDSLEYDSIKYSVLFFADQCEEHSLPSNRVLEERLKESFNIINKDVKFDGENSNFIYLLDYINRHYLYDNLHHNNENPYRSAFEKKDFIILLLTDYLHDVKNENTNKAKEELEKNIRKMGDASANLTLFMLSEGDMEIHSQPKKGKQELKGDQELIKIDDWLQNYLSEDAYQNLDILRFENSFDYPLLLTTPFPFFYSNSIYESSLKSIIAFDRPQDLCFRMRNLGGANRQEIRLHQGNNEKPVRISNNTPKLTIKKEKIELEIFGYIPAPYSLPDIIIEDASKGVQYVLPVVFYKRFPTSALWLLILIFVIVDSLLVMIIKKIQK